MAAEENKQRYQTPKVWPDLPLREGGKVQFHFEDYAATLARLVADKNTRTPLTIGVSGAWGSGKTTLLRQVEKLLGETGARKPPSFANQGETAGDFRKCKTVWFDAWKYDDEDELLVALVRVILAAMRTDGFISKLKAWWEDPEGPGYDFAGMLFDAFELSFGGLGAEFKFKPELKKYEQPSVFKTHTAFFDHFDEAFERLLALWVHGRADKKTIDERRGVLAIFIDDLDRCLPAKTVQVLEAVKLFLDKQGCVFLLGADTRIVQQAVSKHYEETNVLDDDPADYLEKIIQLRFDLPPVQDADMGAYVKSQVTEDQALQAHSRLIALGAAANPRKVKTFLNDLNLRWAMWRNMAQAETVDFDDFVRWEIWMRAAPAFRKRAYDMYDPEVRARLVQAAFDWADGSEEAASSFQGDLNTEMERVLAEILPHRERFTAAVVDRLVHMALLPAAPPEQEEAVGKIKTRQALPVDMEEREPVLVLGERGARKGLQIVTFAGMPFVQIPAGEFIMGSREDNKLAYDDEHPQHTLEIPSPYYLARFPVTNADYGKFAGAKLQEASGEENHPVVGISWYDAQEYIAWLNEKHAEDLPQGYRFALPSEAEWEKAARGEFGNEWPWGNKWDKTKCNSSEAEIGATTPVGRFSPAGDSPYGCADMVGNVWEWTRSLWGAYPYPSEPADRTKREDERASGRRVLRGGSFSDNRRNVSLCVPQQPRSGRPARLRGFSGLRFSHLLKSEL